MPSTIAPQGLAATLKAETRTGHERLDERIMAGRPFADRGRYGRFLGVQADFLAIASPLYQRTDLGLLLPGLAARDRRDALARDLADLEMTLREFGPNPLALPVPEALGWLYVAEGANLGAAVLLKAVRALGLSEDHGARHLAGSPEGRGASWKAFTRALDAVVLADTARARVVSGARDAFAYVHGRVEARFSGSAGLPAE